MQPMGLQVSGAAIMDTTAPRESKAILKRFHASPVLIQPMNQVVVGPRPAPRVGHNVLHVQLVLSVPRRLLRIRYALLLITVTLIPL